MFDSIKSGSEIFKRSFKLFVVHPVLLAPLLLCWLFYGGSIVYFKYYFAWGNILPRERFLIAFAIIFSFAFILSFSCLIVLELIQQIERGRKKSLTKAIIEVITKDVIKTLPLTIAWSLLWFILTLIQMLLSKVTEKQRQSISVENVAKTFAGDENASGGDLLIGIISKGIRMAFFLMLPGIAWDDLSTKNSFKRGSTILKRHFIQFATGFTLSKFLDMLVFLPPTILILITTKMDIQVPDIVWLITIIYCAFGWSYTILMEQIFTAELYLWHLRWELELEQPVDDDKNIPKLSDVRRPSLLDEYTDLV